MSTIKSLESLKPNALFNGVDFKSLKFVCDTKNFTDHKEGDLIYSSGQPSNCIYLIVNGEIKIKQNGAKKLINKASNDFFGETELLGNTERNSSALANSSCLLYKMEKQLVERLLNESQELKSNLLTRNILDVIEQVESERKKDYKENNSLVDLNAEITKSNMENVVQVKPGYETTVDLDKIKVKHYNPTPDLDTFIQQKYLDSDNKSLKSQMIGDADDMSSWIITEENIELKNAQSFNNDAANNEVVISEDEKIYLNDLQPSDDISRVSKNILNFFLEKLSSSVGALYFISPDQQRLEEASQTNTSVIKKKKSINDGITGTVAKSKSIRFCVSYSNDLNYNQEIDKPNGFVGETVIYIPLVDDKNNSLGVVQVGSNEVLFTKAEEYNIKRYSIFCSKILRQSYALNPNAGFLNNSGKTIADFIMQDIKGPLLSLKRYTTILQRLDLPAEVKNSIDQLSEKTIHLVDLLQTVSDYTDKTIKNKLEITNFDSVVYSIVNSLAFYIEPRNVKLHLKQDCPYNVKIDIKKFYVACYYTARFASDVMRQGGNLYFTTSLEDNNAILSVKDENKIIKPVHTNNIFHSEFNITSEAMGLSLAIAKFIVESIQGTITAAADETGTTYIFSIPIVA